VKRLAAVLLVLLAPLTAHAQECAPGRVLTADGYCCWPAQHWSTERARCEGPPACPSPLMAAGDDCLEPSGIGTPQPPSGSFVGAPDPSYGGALEATQPTGPPGAFWPSSSSPPPGGLNPHPVAAVDEGIVGGGIALLGAGYVGSVLISLHAFEEWGIYVGPFRGPDTTCHDVSGAFGLVPVLGPIMAAVEIAACTVPVYVSPASGVNVAFRSGSQGLSTPGWFVFGWTASAVVQLAGLGMILAAILDPGTAVVLDPRPGEVAIVPSGTGDGAMLSLRGAFD